MPIWRALLLLAAAALLLPLFEDVAPALFMLAIVGCALGRNYFTFPLALVGAALLGLLALQKFTYTGMAAVAMLGTTALLLNDHRRRDAAAFALISLASFCLLWIFAGQQLGMLPLFLRRSWQFAAAYSEAMFLNETRAVFLCGVLTLFIAAIVIALAIWRHHHWKRARRLIVALASLGFGFLLWKQSFVRADGHVRGLFLCALGVGLALSGSRAGLALAAVGMLGFSVSSPALVCSAPRLFASHVESSLRALFAPAATQARLSELWMAAAGAAELPKIRAQVGESAVDVFGDEQATLLLNGLNYRPRPVFESHQAYTAELAELNARYYAGKGAPEFVLVRLQTIDGRFLPEDDARVLMLLVQNYQPVLDEKGWQLLQRHRAGPNARWRTIRQTEARFAARIPVPQVWNELLQARIDVGPTLLGRLRTFFYKAAEITLAIDDGDSLRRYRLIRPAARGGFLIAPLFRNGQDCAEFPAIHGRRSADGLFIDASPKFYRPDFSVRFAAIQQ